MARPIKSVQQLLPAQNRPIKIDPPVVPTLTPLPGLPIPPVDFIPTPVPLLPIPPLDLIPIPPVTIRGTEFSDTLHGNFLDNVMYGYPATGPGSGVDDYDGYDTMYGYAGNDVMYGGNQGDSLHGGDGDDTLYGGLATYSGSDYLVGGNGNDKLYGGNDSDRLYGDAGNDSLYGEAANDALFGGTGSDLLVGGTGSDVLTTGTGFDVVKFNHRFEGVDTITDFLSPTDTIQVVRPGFSNGLALGTIAGHRFRLGLNALDASDRFIYHQPSGSLYFDQDGIGGVGKVKLATLSSKPAMNFTDIVVVAS
jgi:Ca2+-binding RTX toxin-like protein